MYNKFFKRFFDIIFSLVAIIVLFPIMIVVAFFVRIKLGKPIIFKQKRAGLYGEIFTLYKFRSMTNATDKNGDYLPNNQRMTTFGKLLRSTSLDELPELFNILKGDMSFIGPRPLLIEYLPRYSNEQMKRHNMRPGLTGLTAVSGRTSLSWKRSLEIDVWYVSNSSFILDLKIIFKTIVTVFKRENISSNRGKFMGTEEDNECK